MASIDRSLSDARAEGCQLGEKGRTEPLTVGSSRYDGAHYDDPRAHGSDSETKAAAENRTDPYHDDLHTRCVLHAALGNESPEDEADSNPLPVWIVDGFRTEYEYWFWYESRWVYEGIYPPWAPEGIFLDADEKPFRFIEKFIEKGSPTCMQNLGIEGPPKAPDEEFEDREKRRDGRVEGCQLGKKDGVETSEVGSSQQEIEGGEPQRQKRGEVDSSMNEGCQLEEGCEPHRQKPTAEECSAEWERLLEEDYTSTDEAGVTRCTQPVEMKRSARVEGCPPGSSGDRHKSRDAFDLLKAVLPPPGGWKMSVIADPGNQTLTCYVPPCLATTRAGHMLAERMLAKDFVMITEEDIGKHRLKATPAEQFHKMEQRLGLQEAAQKVCSHCKQSRVRSKCTVCLTAYYCSAVCQKRDWKAHKPKCVPPQRIACDYNAIAVPDYQCFLEYQEFFCKKASSTKVGICILNRDTFVEKFGEDAVLHTCLALALNGKPDMLLLNICG